MVVEALARWRAGEGCHLLVRFGCQGQVENVSLGCVLIELGIAGMVVKSQLSQRW